MTTTTIGSGPNEEGAGEVDAPMIGKVRQNDMLSIISMENFSEYDEIGFGLAYQMVVDSVFERQWSSFFTGSGVEIRGMLIGQVPSWARKKRLVYQKQLNEWMMNLGSDWCYTRVLVTKEST